MNKKYLVVTPIRDEADFVKITISCMLNQSIVATKWIFVDDNSIDSTNEILQSYVKKHQFINVKTISASTVRLPGVGVMRAFEYGLQNECLDNYDFIVKLDADLEFKPNFFENIFIEFNNNSRLGLASGLILEKNGKPTSDNYEGHTYGNTKIYSTSCFKAILPIEKIKHWDLLDNIKANVNGFESRIIYSEQVIHLKAMDSVVGIKKESKLKGYYSAYLQYNKWFLLFKTIKMVFEPPFFIKGFYFLLGYFSNILIKREFYQNKPVIEMLQKQQTDRLLRLLKLRKK